MKLSKAALFDIRATRFNWGSMRKSLLILFFGITSCNCFGANFVFPGAQGQYGVGLHVVQLLDRSRVYANKVDMVSGTAAQGDRARPIQALVWYPTAQRHSEGISYNEYLRMAATVEKFDRSDAEVNGAVTAYLLDNYPHLDKNMLTQPMLAKRDAPPATAKFPIVVYAPGAGDSASDNADLCEYLASHGYLVIASASVGLNTRSINLDLENAETQARDISFLLGYASTLPQADAKHVAAMGYSFGHVVIHKSDRSAKLTKISVNFQ